MTSLDSRAGTAGRLPKHTLRSALRRSVFAHRPLPSAFRLLSGPVLVGVCPSLPAFFSRYPSSLSRFLIYVPSGSPASPPTCWAGRMGPRRRGVRPDQAARWLPRAPRQHLIPRWQQDSEAGAAHGSPSGLCSWTDCQGIQRLNSSAPPWRAGQAEEQAGQTHLAGPLRSDATALDTAFSRHTDVLVRLKKKKKRKKKEKGSLATWRLYLVKDQ